MLEAEEITVRFGGVTANDAVSLPIFARAVTGLIGPNGAGKTTLFNVISGAVTPGSGHVRLLGEDVTDLRPQALVARGVSRTFQQLALFDDLSVLENVAFGAHHLWPHGLVPTIFGAPRARRSRAAVFELAAGALRLVGLEADAMALAGDLPYGRRRRVEIARALLAGPELLLLDEPSSGMDPAETGDLAELVNTVVDELGIAVFLVEHDMAMVRLTADHLHVLDRGRLIASGATSDVLVDPRVTQAYLGDETVFRA